MKLSDKELRKRDAARDIGAEILQAVREIKAGRGKRVSVTVSPAAAARQMSGLSQADFARLLGVSVRTLQDWEQGRRNPTGAARSLLLLAVKRPKVLREVLRELAEAARIEAPR
jgi:putative transcriptional regulator